MIDVVNKSNRSSPYGPRADDDTAGSVRLGGSLDDADRIRKRHVASLKRSLGLGKDRAGQLHVSIIGAYVHAAVVADNEALNSALLGMETGIDGDQPAARLEGVRRRPQHRGCEIVVQMVKNANRNGDIGPRERMGGKIA